MFPRGDKYDISQSRKTVHIASMAQEYGKYYKLQVKIAHTSPDDPRYDKLVDQLEHTMYYQRLNVYADISDDEHERVRNYYHHHFAPQGWGGGILNILRERNQQIQQDTSVHRTATNPGKVSGFQNVTFIDGNKNKVHAYNHPAALIERFIKIKAPLGYEHNAKYSSPITFIDTETGFDKHGTKNVHVPVSVAAVRVVMNYETGKYEYIDSEVRYYYDEQPTNKETGNIDIHGLTRTQIGYNRQQQSANYPTQYKDDKTFWKNYLSKAKIVQGHNIVDFDLPQSLKIELDPGVNIIDTLTLARNRYGMGGNEQGKLFKEYYGKSPEGFGLPAHDALTDVLMNIYISQAMYATTDFNKAAQRHYSKLVKKAIRKGKPISDQKPSFWMPSGISASMRFIMDNPGRGFSTAPYDEYLKSMVWQGRLGAWQSTNLNYDPDIEPTAYDYATKQYVFALRTRIDGSGKYISIPGMDIRGRALLLGEEPWLMEQRHTEDQFMALTQQLEEALATIKLLAGTEEGKSTLGTIRSMQTLFNPTAKGLKDTAEGLSDVVYKLRSSITSSNRASDSITIYNKIRAVNMVEGLKPEHQSEILSSLGFGDITKDDNDVGKMLMYREQDRRQRRLIREASTEYERRGRTREFQITEKALGYKLTDFEPEFAAASKLWSFRKEKMIKEARDSGRITQRQADSLFEIDSYDELQSQLDGLNKGFTTLAGAMARIPLYDFTRWASAQVSQVSGVSSSLSSILPSWASAPISRLSNLYSLQTASVWEPYKNAVSALSNTVGVVGGSLLMSGIKSGNLTSAGIGAGLGLLASISQVIGNIGETRINQRGYDIQSNIQSIGFIVDYVAMPFRLLAGVTKGLTHSFSSLSKSVINAARNIVNFASSLITNGLNAIDTANPLSYLTGVGYSDYLGTTSIDMATLNSGGTMNGLIENLTSQSKLFNSLGIVDTNKLMAASMLGIGLGAYDSAFTGAASTYNLVDQVYARLQQYEGNETEQSKIMALAGMYDSNLPGILQAMKTWGVSSVSDLSNPSALTGQYWNPISNQSKLTRTQYEWGVAQTQRSNGMQRLGMKIWDSFGKDFYDGINRVIDSIAGGDWPSALDNARQLWTDFKNEVVEIWGKLKTVFFGEEDVSIGDKIWSSIWTPIQNGIVKGLMWMSTTGIPLIVDVWQSLTDTIIDKLAGVIGYLSTIKIDVPGVLKALMNGDPLPEGWFQAGYGAQEIGMTKTKYRGVLGGIRENGSRYVDVTEWNSNLTPTAKAVIDQLGLVFESGPAGGKSITGQTLMDKVSEYYAKGGHAVFYDTKGGKNLFTADEVNSLLRDEFNIAAAQPIVDTLKAVNSTVTPFVGDLTSKLTEQLAEGIAGSETTIKIIMETDTGKRVADIAVDAKGNIVNAVAGAIDNLKVHLNTLAERSVNLALEQRN